MIVAVLENVISNYQFFGKANDPDTAKYYEQFFKIIKKETKSVSHTHRLTFDARVTKGEKEQSKVRAEVFFELKQGEFVVYSDGKEKRVQFKKNNIKKELPKRNNQPTDTELQGQF